MVNEKSENSLKKKKHKYFCFTSISFYKKNATGLEEST